MKQQQQQRCLLYWWSLFAVFLLGKSLIHSILVNVWWLYPCQPNNMKQQQQEELTLLYESFIVLLRKSLLHRVLAHACLILLMPTKQLWNYNKNWHDQALSNQWLTELWHFIKIQSIVMLMWTYAHAMVFFSNLCVCVCVCVCAIWSWLCIPT